MSKLRLISVAVVVSSRCELRACGDLQRNDHDKESDAQAGDTLFRQRLFGMAKYFITPYIVQNRSRPATGPRSADHHPQGR